MCYGASQIKFWSQYSSDGRQRYCMTLAAVPHDPTSKRVIRIFGGRKHVLRPENDGRCDPESCAEYQSRQCNLTGKFVFFIPGITTIQAVELPTNSFYAMNAARQKLEMIAFMRGGRISGFLDGKATFWMAKQLQEVLRIDEEGRPVRVKQWLIDLEAPIDPTRLLRIDDETRLREGDEAARVLTGGGGQVIDVPVTHHAGESDTAHPEDRSHELTRPSLPREHQHQPAAATTRADKLSVEVLLREIGIPAEKFDAYANKKWGKGWKLNANGIKRALAEIEAHRRDPAALLNKIGQEPGGTS